MTTFGTAEQQAFESAEPFPGNLFECAGQTATASSDDPALYYVVGPWVSTAGAKRLTLACRGNNAVTVALEESVAAAADTGFTPSIVRTVVENTSEVTFSEFTRNEACIEVRPVGRYARAVFASGGSFSISAMLRADVT